MGAVRHLGAGPGRLVGAERVCSHEPMDGDRVEIELVPTDADSATRSNRPWRRDGGSDERSTGERPDADGVDPDVTGEAGGSGPADRGAHDERRRLVVVGAVAAMIALLVGWTIGRAGSSSGTAESSIGVTIPGTEAVTSSVAPTVARATVPPVVDATVPPVDDPVPTTVGDIDLPPGSRPGPIEADAAITTARAAIDPRLAGLDDRVVGLASDGAVLDLDLAAGTLTEYDSGASSQGGVQIVAGDDWVVLAGFGGAVVSTSAVLVRDDGTVEATDVASGDVVMHTRGSDTFWRPPPYFGPGSIELEEVTVDGEVTGASFELPTGAWPSSGDALGGVAVNMGGRWFSVGPDRSSPLGTGELLALGPEIALMFDCPQLDDCAVFRLDRASGDSTRVPLSPPIDDARLIPSMWFRGDVEAPLSPDGRHLAIARDDGGGALDLVVIDLLTGTMVDLATEGGGPSSVEWLADGAYLVYLESLGVPTVYDVATGESFPLFTEAPAEAPTRSWIALTLRP